MKKIASFSIFIFIVKSFCFSQIKIKSLDEINGLSVGDSVENFQAINQYGDTFDLYQSLKEGPLVLIFYRGQWCPVCNRYLSNMQDSIKFIYQKGAKVVAISPEKPELLAKTKQKTDAEFILLHDEGYKIAAMFDVLFKPSNSTLFIYNTFAGADLKDAHGQDEQLLPVPATFIIGKNKKILWRHFDRNYKIRAGVWEILQNIP